MFTALWSLVEKREHGPLPEAPRSSCHPVEIHIFLFISKYKFSTNQQQLNTSPPTSERQECLIGGRGNTYKMIYSIPPWSGKAITFSL